MVFFIVAAFGIMHLLRGRADILVIVGTALLIIGCVGVVSITMLEAARYAIGDAGFDTSTQEAMSAALDTGTGWKNVALNRFLTGGPGLPLGLLILSIGIYWARAAELLAAGLLAVGAISFPIGRISGSLIVSIVSDILLLAGMGLIGWQILKLSVDEWERSSISQKEAPTI